jgi:hypothetical protein
VVPSATVPCFVANALSVPAVPHAASSFSSTPAPRGPPVA